MKLASACLLASSVNAATAEVQKTQDDHPHLAQAWQALSSGDGLPDTVGLESYIYEDCPGKHGGQLFSETCMSGHVFDYGAENCIKYEVNMGAHSKYTGTYYVKCDSVDCCKDASTQARPDIKKWDIGQGKNSAISHLEATDLDDLDGHVAGADTWSEFINALGVFSVNYTYYITQSENGDVISHAIDYSAPGAAPGRILYGNFTVKHADELDDFRDVFKAPAACLKNNVLHCSDNHVQKWDSKLFRRGPVADLAPVVV
jgi:hypothetical protein